MVEEDWVGRGIPVAGFGCEVGACDSGTKDVDGMSVARVCCEDEVGGTGTEDVDGEVVEGTEVPQLVM